ncbi:ABC transporter related protein [Geobacter metallireducens RCH3]|uniref:Organic solvent tolerance ABC transporter, ATP-binding protein n=1 Tax=Geobacter metallireducens (strain ATCC 53774 / DSM 7210 / GS-15) TaxID=269799 RepID=Q39XJ5_GEOMG|nr:ABC transporter ATP-binding protein [Geobacter metallireducens]ABB31029.1 organic solvent tolerance ABC transporter, ATP-binding protein [Geobacter metallireducens GS-15]EHP86035.1 ABC transporter related protein [Geobacter metallireducens RCH3]
MIKLVDIHKSFDSQTVLDGLSLEIPEGKITAVIGPSGEGKSVLLKHMIGLMKPDRGQVHVDGENITAMRRFEMNRVWEKFGMLFQNAALFDSMTVFENVAFPLEEKTRFSRAEIRDRVHNALENVGLRGIDKKYPDELSGGMKKRVGLARALLLNPRIILFDEPTTGLDPIICRAIHQLIRDTHERYGYTAVIVSHEIPEIFDISDQVAMLYRGRITEMGTPEEIRRSEHPVVRQFISGSLEGPIKFI